MVFISAGCAGVRQPAKFPTRISTGNYITIFSEGTADIMEAGIAEATDRAYLDAQHKAIEKALGKLYSARTVVESGLFISQTVMANVRGYIRKWEKIAGPEARDFPGTTEKIVWVKISAEVGLDKLKEDTLALEETQRRLGRPDIAVILDNNHAKQVINNKLKQMKFTVRDLGTEVIDPVKSAIENKIEIIIKGNVNVASAGKIMEGVNLESFQSQVNLQAINVFDGEILAHSSAHGAYPHIEKESGKAGAVRKASELAADRLMEKLLVAWENILNNGSGLYLKVKGLSLNRESDFKKILERHLRGFREIHGKGLKDGVFSFKIMYLGNARQLAKNLNSIKGAFNIKVTGYAVNVVEVEVK